MQNRNIKLIQLALVQAETTHPLKQNYFILFIILSQSNYLSADEFRFDLGAAGAVSVLLPFQIFLSHLAMKKAYSQLQRFHSPFNFLLPVMYQ